MRKLLARPKLSIKKDKDSIISIGLTILVIGLTLYPIFSPSKAQAAVTQAFVRIDRLGTGELISGSACIETTTAGTETNVTIVFPSDWTISQTEADWVANNTNLPYDPTDPLVQATMWPGITNTEASAIVNGTSVTWAGADISNSTTFYCFNFAGASSNVGAAGDNKTGALKTEGGSPYVDDIDWAVDVVTADADQIVVTASVSAQMTFALGSNSVNLGSLSTGTTAEGSVTQTVTTNARNGWISWVRSETNGGGGLGALNSAVATDQIDSVGTYDGAPSTLTSSGGYVLDVDTNTGCATGCVNDEYEGSDPDQGGTLAYNIFHITASDTTPTAGDLINLKPRARSSATTKAGSDYTDTLTVVAAGSF